MSEKEYIERGALVGILDAKSEMAMGTPKAVFASVSKMVELLPAADVVDVRHGYWKNYGAFCVCSVCGESNPRTKPYCPNCGANMDVERKDNP